MNKNNTRNIKLSLTDKQMKELKKRDEEARNLVQKIKEDKAMEKMFILDKGVLYRLWLEERETFKCTFMPKILRDPMFVLAHNRNGHNGRRRTNMSLKKMYYWPGMKKDIFKHCKNCVECSLQNQANNSAGFSHFFTPEMPMQLICMDLVGPISPMTSRRNKFILTCIDVLTGFTIAVPIKHKMANTICNTYRTYIYCTFGGSSRILKDKGTEFKNDQFDELCKQLEIKRVYSPVYTAEGNGRLEAWHCFCKACVAKHIPGNADEWDEVVLLVAAAYNFFPCQSTGESPFVLIFGRDPVTPFAKLLEPTPRSWGDRGSHLKMDLLKKLYLVTAENVKRAKEWRDPARKESETTAFKVNDKVLVRDVNSGAFAPRYTPHYRVVAVHIPNRIVVRDEKWSERVRRASHLTHCDTKTKFTSMVPENSEYTQFGRSTKLLLHTKDVPELHFPQETATSIELATPEQWVTHVVIESITDKPVQYRKSSEILPEMNDEKVQMEADNDDSNRSSCSNLK